MRHPARCLSGPGRACKIRAESEMIKQYVVSEARLVGALLLVLSALPAVASPPGDPRSGELYQTLREMDRELFEVAFVSCDAQRFRELFTEDAEFYHDQSGPSFGEAVRTLGSCPAERGVRRVLVEGSLEVYPMKDFGALQQGEHWFVEAGATTSTRARFVHLWRFADGRWRIARVMSFDHQSRPKGDGPP